MWNDVPNESEVGSIDLYFIDDIYDETSEIVIANYIFNKTFTVKLAKAEFDKLSITYRRAITQSMFLSVLYDEKEGVIKSE